MKNTLAGTDRYLRDAFLQVCQTARPAKSHYVSLYVNLPYYGGPEEGGWWGHDTELVAYYECLTAEEAEVVKSRVQSLALELNKEAKDRFNARCAAECEWLEARGLDADFFPEVDGEENYWIATEERPGEHASEGSRHYE